MTTFYFVRHPETTFNKLNKWAGQIEAPLSKNGIKQSRLLCNDIKKYGIDFIICSPSQRCVNLAKTINTKHNIPYAIDVRLIERSFGKLEGHATDINDKRAISLWDLNSDLGLNVEKIQNMYYKRVVPTIRDLIKKYPNKTILIISHSWVGRLMKYYFDPKKDPILILQTPQNATLIKLNSSY